MSAAYKFDDQEFDILWQSIKSDGGITPGTLFHHAKESGWIDPVHQQVQQAQNDARDIKNGRLFAEANRGRLLFVAETGDVLKFSSEGWVRADIGEAEVAAKAVISKIRHEANELFKQSHDHPIAKQLSKHADFSSTAPRIQAMIDLAKSEPEMSKRISLFDADPNLLGVANGVLDLKNKNLLWVSPDLLISMRANVKYDPNARCPRMEVFLKEIQPHGSVRRLLQQLSGICLSGHSNIQKLIFLFGQGANGKSTFIELIAWILGDYTKRIPTEMLMQHQRNPQGPSPDIVGLKGRRMVYCNEVEEGRHLAEARVKELTGGDTLSGRVPYAKEDITFQPTHKLVMVGNHQPEIHDMSHGMWRRVLLIPFEQTISKGKCDPNILGKLKSEASGILNWMLEGYHDYLKNGLVVPDEVSDAVEIYKDEQDVIGEWIKENCNINANSMTSKSFCYLSYRDWTIGRGNYPLSQSRFTRRLADRGYKLDKGRRNITGIEMRGPIKNSC